VHALAVAEARCEFEHRDLHWGNILLKQLPDDAAPLAGMLDGEPSSIAHAGVQACLIDFTLSRLKTSSGVLCCRLDELEDDWLFTQREGEGDPQARVSTTRESCVSSM
jgi:serine/threonine-protein kinase haspin